MKHDHFTDEKIPMTTDLKVPFTEKEHAKALGARWDADRRTWYAPDGVDLAGFAQWIPASALADDETESPLVWRTVRSERFMLVLSFTTCWKCGQRTEVFALLLPPRHSVTDRAAGPHKVTIREYIDGSPAALTYTQKISDEATLYLASAAPAFRKDFSKTTQSIYWANHCAGCDALIGDFGQHYEPGGAFSGLWDLDLSGSEPITILPVNIPIECSFQKDLDEPSSSATPAKLSPAMEWLRDDRTGCVRRDRRNFDHRQDWSRPAGHDGEARRAHSDGRQPHPWHHGRDGDRCAVMA